MCHQMQYPRRFLLLLVFVGSLLGSESTSTQSSAGDPGLPRTLNGRPNLQGVWDFSTITPMERPRELAEQELLTAEEAAALEERRVRTRNYDQRDSDPETDLEGAYNDFWYDWGTTVVSTRRTSLVVDPGDGRIPQLTLAGKRRRDARSARPAVPVGPEDLPFIERCYLGFNSGPPIVPSAYNNNLQLFQTPNYFVILTEMVHEARIVPLDGRPHLPSGFSQWLGDSRGYWEGDTLVVQTRNFRGETNFNPKGTRVQEGSAAQMHLVERFTRLDAETLLYEFTVNDPTTWTRSWTAAVPMRPAAGPIFEYACHEGNYGMLGMLNGARAEQESPQ